jgi:outer membrane protein assembly factor BamB
MEASPVIVPHIDGNGSALVVVGQDANESDPSGPLGVIGLVLAPDGTLTPKWQFDPELGVATPGLAPLDPTQTHHGCGDVWSSPSVDLTHGIDHGVVVFGTGNCNNPDAVSKTATTRPVESTFAIRLLTGELLWQQSPHAVGNDLDVDFGATPNMLGGGLVGEGGKDGIYYAYALTGPRPVAPATADPVFTTQVATPSNIGGMIGSTAVGKLGPLHDNHQAIFAASAIPVSSSDTQGSLTVDAEHPTEAFGVHAIDATTHQVVWDAPAGPAYGAATYDNGVVFVPDTFTDSLMALDADTGAILRVQPLDAPPASPVAISGDAVYLGAGTTESSPPLSALSSFGGVWGFETVG